MDWPKLDFIVTTWNAHRSPKESEMRTTSIPLTRLVVPRDAVDPLDHAVLAASTADRRRSVTPRQMTSTPRSATSSSFNTPRSVATSSTSSTPRSINDSDDTNLLSSPSTSTTGTVIENIEDSNINNNENNANNNNDIDGTRRHLRRQSSMAEIGGTEPLSQQQQKGPLVRFQKATSKIIRQQRQQKLAAMWEKRKRR